MFADCLSKRLFSLIFQVVFVLGMLDSNCWHVSSDRILGRCFQDTLELGGGVGWGFLGLVGSCVFSPFYQFGIIFLLLSSCNMTRGQEETSTSQTERRRGLSWDMPSASCLISSLSIEELRSYCQIPNNIDFELPDGPTEPTID